MSAVFHDLSTQAKWVPALEVAIRGDGDDRRHSISALDYIDISHAARVRLSYLPDGTLDLYVEPRDEVVA